MATGLVYNKPIFWYLFDNALIEKEGEWSQYLSSATFMQYRHCIESLLFFLHSGCVCKVFPVDTASPRSSTKQDEIIQKNYDSDLSLYVSAFCALEGNYMQLG